MVKQSKFQMGMKMDDPDDTNGLGLTVAPGELGKGCLVGICERDLRIPCDYAHESSRTCAGAGGRSGNT